MKRVTIVLTMILVLMLCSCSTQTQRYSDDDYYALKGEYDRYKQSHQISQEEWQSLQDEYAAAQSECKELKETLQSYPDISEIESLREEYDRLTKEVEILQSEELRKLTEGTTVYEDEYVRINYQSVQYTTKHSKSYAVVFWVENKTDTVLTIQCDTLALDGISIDGNPSCSDEVSPKSKGKIYVRYEYIDNNNPQLISGQLRIIDFSKTVIQIPYSPGSLIYSNNYDATFVDISLIN